MTLENFPKHGPSEGPEPVLTVGPEAALTTNPLQAIIEFQRSSDRMRKPMKRHIIDDVEPLTEWDFDFE